MTNRLVIEENNLSRAWAKAFLMTTGRGITEIHPMIVVITDLVDGVPAEDLTIRGLVDKRLQELGKATSETVASTIFPRSLWNPSMPRSKLYERYLNILPRVQQNHRANQYGTYFGRLIAFGAEEKNQLEHIIQTYQSGNHRRSALQATILDPLKDHTNQRQRGFPCLQQVNFTAYGEGQLEVTGLYANQYIFSKAYGNYLGLARLGQFIAHELGLSLERVICHASFAVAGNVTKAKVRDLNDLISTIVLTA